MNRKMLKDRAKAVLKKDYVKLLGFTFIVVVLGASFIGFGSTADYNTGLTYYYFSIFGLSFPINATKSMVGLVSFFVIAGLIMSVFVRPVLNYGLGNAYKTAAVDELQGYDLFNGFKQNYSNIVKVKMEEKPLVRGNSQSNYVRLTVDIKNDYAIRLLAKTEEPKSGIPFLFVNFYSMLIIVSVGMILLIIAKSNKNNTKRNKTVSYTHFPSSYLSSPQDYIYSRSTGMDIPQQKPILPKVNIKKNLKTADSDSFSCFDIPLVEDTKNSSYEFKSTLKQTSNLMKEKTAKSKQTNPINRTYAEENSQFSLPVVDDLPVIEKPIIQESKKNEPELISALNITPNKGFYLTTAEDDMFALFGFVGDNVFLLKKFIDLTQINLQARYYDRAQNGNEIYIVRMDSYKAMIEVSNNGMRETAVL